MHYEFLFGEVTVDIGSPCTLADKPVRGLEYVVEADAEAYFLDYLAEFKSSRFREIQCMARERSTLFAYLALILSVIASPLGFCKSSGVICTRSEMVVCLNQYILSLAVKRTAGVQV